MNVRSDLGAHEGNTGIVDESVKVQTEKKIEKKRRKVPSHFTVPQLGVEPMQAAFSGSPTQCTKH